MLEPTLPPLAGWESFYVITGSSAAALTGLMFVVVTLTAERRDSGATPDALRAFATPTIVHFGAVLLLAALLTAPWESAPRLALCVGASGLAGIAYVGWVTFKAGQQTTYAPEPSDWIWYSIVPLVAYGCLLAASIVLWRHPAPALYAVGAAALVLLYVGIHNAWDSAVWLAVERPRS